MKLTRCPSCHGNIHLDTLVQDVNAKALLGTIVKLPSNLAANLVAYVALFRPVKSDLSNERAARLINEVLALSHNHNALLSALEQTILQIQQKRLTGSSQPLKNHGYLTKVLDTIIEHHQLPMQSTCKASFVIKQQGKMETPEENQALFEQQLARYRDNEA